MCFKKFVLGTLILFVSHNLFSQIDTNAFYWIEFKYKGNSEYTLSEPQLYLSSKSIERRERYNIKIDSIDLPVNNNFVQAIQNAGVKVVKKSKWLNGVVVTSMDSLEFESIKNLSFVKKSDKVSPFKKRKESTRGPVPIAEKMDADVLDYGKALRQITQLKLDCLHQENFLGQGMTIAVLDAGFYNVDSLLAFEKLRQRNGIKGTKDFVDLDDMVYDYSSTHGTLVLSCMAANLPGQLMGTAPEADYYLIRTENSASEYIIEEYNWSMGAEYADSVGADIINSSLGYTNYDDNSTSHTYTEMNGNTCPSTRAADFAASRGILVVNSAGNSGNNTWKYIGAPADADSILAVGAVDSIGAVAGFSSYGPSSDGRVKPDVSARGRSTWIVSSANNVTKGDGTSFASPILAGAVACFWQSLPKKNNIEIIALTKKYGSHYDNPNDRIGYGIPNFCDAYWEQIAPISVIDTFGVPVLLPNPFENVINILYHSDMNEDLNIQVFDASGKQIFSNQYKVEEDYYYNFDINPLVSSSDGIYLIHFQTDSKMYTLKAIKNK